MKIVLVNTSDRKGGAAVACMRLAQALRKAGAEVNVLVLHKETALPFVTEILPSRWGAIRKKWAFLLERLDIFRNNGLSKKGLFSVSTASFGFDISQHPLIQEADIVHFHWINQGFVSLKGIDGIIDSGKPLIWTMHDLWPVMGICHYAHGCERFRAACGECPQLIRPASGDLSARIMARKKRFMPDGRIQFVSCSHWLGEVAKGSSLAPGNRFIAIPNPIDISFFQPGDKSAARKALGLPLDKKLILFGAVIASDKRKGLDYLLQASRVLASKGLDADLVMCGQIKEKGDLDFGLPLHELGYVSDPQKLRLMYQAADVFVTPSLEENLPNMIMEAMACATPCVGFDVGGIPEMITHLQTGYVAKYLSVDDLADGIVHVLERSADPAYRAEVRSFVEENYAEPKVAARYLDIYKENIAWKNV